MRTGRVIKNYNGYYYVDTGDGALIECRRRGKLKEKILVGDRLTITMVDDAHGVIEGQLPRQNALRRPAIANIDQMIVIMAAASPDPSQFLIDKMLMTCEYNDIPAVLCFNKCDLNEEGAREFQHFYEACGYTVYLVSAKTGEGLEAIRVVLPGKMTAFAGPSGVGKSSLLSQLLGRDDLSIGAVSNKIKRGRHTTRHSEIMAVDDDGTYVVDTPGFSSLDFTHIEPRLVMELLPEFRPYLGACRFGSCLHRSEPDCAVKDAVAAGNIQPERYETYTKIIDSIEAERKR